MKGEKLELNLGEDRMGLHIVQAQRRRTCHMCKNSIKRGEYLVEIALVHSGRYFYNNVCIPCFYEFLFSVNRRVPSDQAFLSFSEAVRRFKNAGNRS